MGTLSIYLAGTVTPLSQIGRIREGFELVKSFNGNEIQIVSDPSSADLIFSNNPPFGDLLALKDAGKLKSNAKLIFNILDIPTHLLGNGYNPYENYEALTRADAVTVISEYVRSQVHNYYGLAPYLIYNPIKDVEPSIRQSNTRPFPQFKALLAGRVADPNKHHWDISIPALQMVGIKSEQVAVIGGEQIPYGTNLGIVDDKTLNELYNSVDYVLFPSFSEGLGLPPIEGMICGAIPIFTTALSTAQEFRYPLRWQTHPSAPAFAYRIAQLEQSEELRKAESELALQLGASLAQLLNKEAIARNVLNVYSKLI